MENRQSLSHTAWDCKYHFGYLRACLKKRAKQKGWQIIGRTFTYWSRLYVDIHSTQGALDIAGFIK